MLLPGSGGPRPRPRGRGARVRCAPSTDPDPRFTLANERTFLAWIRTVLGLIASALALEMLGNPLLDDALRRITVLTLLAFSLLLSVGALHRWFRVEVAIRTGKPLPLPGIAVVMMTFVLGTAVCVAVAAGT
ncbi:DUF202 domain-containing protein [Rhodococcus sp. DMU1]|uniref:YidH family protein n=1 Tax=Rhodococcus sp. DMU1 TaxID=2722825 RepID=UPI0032B84601